MVFIDGGATSDADDTTSPSVGTVLLVGAATPNLTTSETTSKAFLRFSARGALTGAERDPATNDGDYSSRADGNRTFIAEFPADLAQNDPPTKTE